MIISILEAWVVGTIIITFHMTFGEIIDGGDIIHIIGILTTGMEDIGRIILTMDITTPGIMDGGDMDSLTRSMIHGGIMGIIHIIMDITILGILGDIIMDIIMVTLVAITVMEPVMLQEAMEEVT